MSTVIDFGYAANAEELAQVIASLTETANCHPSIVQLGGMQIRVTLEAKCLEDSSTVFDLRFHFLSESEARNERR